MPYLEYTFGNFGSEEKKEILIAILDSKGYSGFIESDDFLIAYLPEDMKDESDLRDLTYRLDSKISFKSSDVPQVNWNAKWESEFQPVNIDGIVKIRASFHEKDASFLYDLLIDPKMSFGTGHHETTRMMVRSMLKLEFSEKKVLDMGSGTGILAILASKMGADSVIAMDIDEWAYKNCLENVKNNECSNVEVILGSGAQLPREKYHIILANINRNVLLDTMDIFYKLLNREGSLVLSGIMQQDLDPLKQAAVKSGFSERSSMFENKWHCLVFGKDGSNL